MDGKKIVEILQKYTDNPNIINDDNYFKSLIEAIIFIAKYDKDYLEINDIEMVEEFFDINYDLLKTLFKHSKLIDYALNNYYVMYKVYEYVSVEEFLKFNEDKVLIYIENNDYIPSNWKKNKNLFEYILEHNKSLISKLNLEEFFPEITDEVLLEYGKEITTYIKNTNKLNFSWLNNHAWSTNKKLFEYILEKDKSLIIKFELEEIFHEITDEVLLEYGKEIITYVKNTSSLDYSWRCDKKLFEYVSKHDASLIEKFNLEFVLPDITDDIFLKYKRVILNYIKNTSVLGYKWSENKILFQNISKIDKNLLTKFNLNKIFPEITDKVLSEYGHIILDYLENDIFLYEWKESRLLFKFLSKNNKDLLSKFNIKELFPELTEDIFKEYGDAIIVYLENNKFPYKWDCNKELFKYLAKNNLNLILKLDLGRIFPEITDEVLLEYGKEILFYLKEKGCPYGWRTDKKLFYYISKKDKDLIIKFNLEEIFPKITDEFLLEYGNQIITYVKNTSSLDYSWRRDKKLFEYILKYDKNLILKFDLECLFPKITNEILLEYDELILQYIDKKNGATIWNDECLLAYLIKNNISLIKKMTVESYFSKDEYIELLASNLEINKDTLKYKLEYLYRKNDELFKTLDFRILKIDKISMDELSKFTLYPDIQEKIINLDSNLVDVFSKILKLLNSSKYDFSNIVVKVLDNIDNYKELITNIQLQELNEERIKNLVFILQRSENIFEINSIEDLDDISFLSKKRNYFSSIENNLSDMDLETLKKAIFEKKYAIDIEMSKFIYERYYHNLEELRKSGLNENVINLIQEIANLLNEESIENLRIIYQESEEIKTDFYTSLSLEATIRKEYTKMYLDTLYKVSNNDKSKHASLENVTYNGKKVDFYEIDGDFNMQVHGLGAYREWTRPENFKNDWLRPKISYHGICTSYIGNNQIATARPNGPILGFSSYEESALMLAGNYDLFSDEAILDYSTAYHTPYSFLPPKTMIDSTRHNHNEMDIERINKDTAISHKRMPNYVVYIVDDINNQNNFSSENEYYQMTLQCATDMDLPIVVVDRLKYAKREMAKCVDLENKFYESKDLNCLEELFLTYMNNGVGCRLFEKQTKAEYHDIFSEQVINNFYKRLVLYIKEDLISLKSNSKTEEDIKKIGEVIFTLIKLLNHEKESYSVSHKSYRLTPPIKLEEELVYLKDLYDEYKKRVVEVSVIYDITSSENDMNDSKIM